MDLNEPPVTRRWRTEACVMNSAYSSLSFSLIIFILRHDFDGTPSIQICARHMAYMTQNKWTSVLESKRTSWRFLSVGWTVVQVLEMRFALSKCRMLLHDWIGSQSNFVLAGEELGKVHRFSYLGVVSHPVIVYRVNCHHRYKRLDCYWPTWGICGVGVTSVYR